MSSIETTATTHGPHRPLPTVGRLLRAAVGYLLAQQERVRQCALLLESDDRMLKDMRPTRADIGRL